MRVSAVAVGLSMSLAATAANAHFRLDAPASATVQNPRSGDPQKPDDLQDGCPAGTATGDVTVVAAGSNVKVKIDETVSHPGHYRVSLAARESEFSYPQTVTGGNACISTSIASPPTLPVLADGLFVHTDANLTTFCNGGKTCETEITVPASTAPGNYILQVVQWMLGHGTGADATGCFYAHCANLQVVAQGTPIPDGGTITVDAGATPPDDANEATPASGSSRRSSTPTESSGCQVGSANGVSFALPLLVGLALLRRRRR